METTGTDEPKGLVTAARRALHILEAVAESGDGTTAKAVVHRTGLSPSTVYQYLSTLVHEGYLVRLHDVGGYGLGWKSSDLRSATSRTIGLVALYDLHQQAAAPFYVVRFCGVRPEIASILDSPVHPRAREDVASFTEAVHASAFGRVLLSSLSFRDRVRYFEGAGMRRLTAATPTRLDDVEAKIEKIRSTGVSIDAGEFVPDLVCVAVPIRKGDGRIAGALAASVSRSGFAARHREIERAVRNAAARLSG